MSAPFLEDTSRRERVAARLKLTFSLCHSSLARPCKTIAARNARSASFAAAGPRYTQLCGIPQTALIYVLPVSAYGLYIYIAAPSYPHKHTRTGTREHPYTYAHSCTHTCSHYARAYPRTDIHTHIHARTHMHEHAHAHTHTHTHTHTHSSYFDAWFEQSRLFWALV